MSASGHVKAATRRKLFVTTALPYANGPFHIGHIMEYIQADIWVRFQRMQGNEVTSSAPTTPTARRSCCGPSRRASTPQGLVAQIAATRPKHLAGFHIELRPLALDRFARERRAVAGHLSAAARHKASIYAKPVEQFYDPVKEMFLPDRYIKGECPKCGAKDQYGDACENCGSTYAPTDLVNPYSTLSGAKPVLRTSEHFSSGSPTPEVVAFLSEWTASPAHGQSLQPEVLNKVREWLGSDGGGDRLADWDISRDAPYFGIPIPDAPGKYFYVWLDAPIGYLASLKAHLARKGRSSFAQFLQDPATSSSIHFIGKDIVYFHTLFWPAMLKFAGAPYKVPTNVFVHGFIDRRRARRCRSRAAPASAPTSTSTSASIPNGCAITSRPS